MYNVLIVDDDPMVAMINERYISRSESLRVIGKCGSGQEALELLEKKSADLVILDVYMPKMNGIETLREIRSRNIPVSVIMVTAANDLDTFEAATRLGAIDYLVKPFDYQRFKLALDKFDAKSSTLRGGNVLNQNMIDKVMGAAVSEHEAAPKGIQEKTRAMIIDSLAASGGWMTGEEIAEKTGLSSVTVRRYMNHLVESGSVTGKMNYETGGRPSMMYRV